MGGAPVAASSSCAGAGRTRVVACALTGSLFLGGESGHPAQHSLISLGTEGAAATALEQPPLAPALEQPPTILSGSLFLILAICLPRQISAIPHKAKGGEIRQSVALSVREACSKTGKNPRYFCPS